MSKIVWFLGPPPHIGWWCANTMRCDYLWRWWDGACWSPPAHSTEDSAAVAGRLAKYKSPSGLIKWCNYYPPNARTPRINPTEKTT